MCVRDRGFALMLVLIASAGAFALAAQASLTARASMTETRAFIDRAESTRRARGAAVVALTGLLTPAQGFNEGAVESEGAGRAATRNATGIRGAGSDEPDATDIELPAIVRDLLRGMLDEAEEQQEERERNRETIANLNGGAGVDSATDPDIGVGARLLEKFGLPARDLELELPGDEWTYILRFTDAIGLLDINEAEEDQLATYFALKGVAPERARAIAQQMLDWRDADSFVRPLGAEARNYEGSGIEITNDRFVALDELLYMPSMTREIYELVRADLILDGTETHANSAPHEVLASVPGMSQSFAQRIIEARAQKPLDAETLRAIAPPNADEAMAYLRTKPSNVVRVRVEMRRDDGSARRVFVGHAAFGESGIRAVALAPVYDQPESES